MLLNLSQNTLNARCRTVLRTNWIFSWCYQKLRIKWFNIYSSWHNQSPEQPKRLIRHFVIMTGLLKVRFVTAVKATVSNILTLTVLAHLCDILLPIPLKLPVTDVLVQDIIQPYHHLHSIPNSFTLYMQDQRLLLLLALKQIKLYIAMTIFQCTDLWEKYYKHTVTIQ